MPVPPCRAPRRRPAWHRPRSSTSGETDDGSSPVADPSRLALSPLRRAKPLALSAATCERRVRFDHQTEQTISTNSVKALGFRPRSPSLGAALDIEKDAGCPRYLLASKSDFICVAPTCTIYAPPLSPVRCAELLTEAGWRA